MLDDNYEYITNKGTNLEDMCAHYIQNNKLFYHFISSPESYYEKHNSNRIPKYFRKLSPKKRLEKILKEKRIIGNPKGYFVNKTNDYEDIRSVAFSFAEYERIPDLIKRRDSSYAIVFNHNFLFNKGIKKVEYLNNNPDEKKLAIRTPHLIETWSPKYDMRWENEHRIFRDLDFTINDIAFIISPRKIKGLPCLCSMLYTQPRKYFTKLFNIKKKSLASFLAQAFIEFKYEQSSYKKYEKFYNSLITTNHSCVTKPKYTNALNIFNKILDAAI